jgi:hypothetical protein
VYRHFILERDYPQVPAIQFGHWRPESISALLLRSRDNRIFDDLDAALFLEVGAFTQNLVLEVLGESIGRHGGVERTSQQATFRKRHHAIARHDEVIQCPDIHQRERLFERLRQKLISARRLGDA